MWQQLQSNAALKLQVCNRKRKSKTQNDDRAAELSNDNLLEMDVETKLGTQNVAEIRSEAAVRSECETSVDAGIQTELQVLSRTSFKAKSYIQPRPCSKPKSNYNQKSKSEPRYES
ncbi:unnamed protein product [Ceratitis capitata]|uniref:(Mediterranean fruit fly) hypothetical protein n=1 Tax=Ceratitis capitata TaxID=7213 RepID=A0A811ULD7_CERCA|nr:unnamed protein product [Ceratitis capitata]